jgi:uncharacterized protein (DUF2237 family)
VSQSAKAAKRRTGKTVAKRLPVAAHGILAATHELALEVVELNEFKAHAADLN